MEIKINGKTLLLGLALTAAFTFGEYVSIISGGGYISQAAIPEDGSVEVVERKETATGGYTIWSDGYKEAWGQFEKGSSLSNVEEIVINLPFTFDSPNKAYANANIKGRIGSGDSTVNVGTITTTTASFLPDGSHSGTLAATGITWTVKGY